MLDLGIELMELTKHKEISLSFEVLKRIVWQLVEGLDHMHGKGFMHRDVKPSNVYLMRNGVVRLGDFSISRTICSGMDEEKGEEMEEDKEEKGKKTGNVTTRHYRAP